MSLLGEKYTDSDGSPRLLTAEVLSAVGQYRLFEPLQEGFLVIDGDWCLLYVNPAGARILDRPRRSLLGDEFWRALPEIADSPVARELREARETGETRTFRAHIPRSGVWLQGRAEPNGDGLCLYLQNVTAAWPIAEVVEKIEDAFVLLDRDGRYVYANREAARLAGCAPEELIGRNHRELYPKSHSSPIYDAVARTFQTRQPVHLETVAPTHGRQVSMSFYPQGEYVAIFTRDITSLKASEARVRESEQEFRVLFELSAIGKAQVDIETRRFRRVNRKFCEMTGYTPEELYAMSFSDITHPADRESDRERFEEVLRSGGDHWTSEKRYVHKDGHSLWVQVHGRVLRDAEGRPVRSMAAVLDITEHRMAEEALRRSEERFATAFAASPDGLAITRMDDGLIREANNSFLSIFGLTREEAIGNRSSLDLNLFPDPADRERAVQKIRDEGRLRDYEITVQQRHSTTPRILLLSAERLPTEGESTLLTIMRDITERKQMQKALQESEFLYRQLAENLPHQVWITLADGTVIFCNQRWFDFTGTKTVEEANDAWIRGLHPDDQAAMWSLWQTCRKTGEPFQAEYRFRSVHDPAYRWHLGRAVPLRDEKGDIFRWFGTTTDIHDQKRAEVAISERVRDIEAIMNAAPVSICIAYDRECASITGNAWAYRLLRISDQVANLSKSDPEQETLTHFTIWSDGRLLENHELPMQYAAATGEEVRDWEIELRFSDGVVTTCVANASPLYDTAGQIRGAVGCFIDNTEQKQRRTEIERLNENLRRSLLETHHRVKNNLQVIAAMLEMQALQYNDSLPTRELTRLLQHINALAAIHDLLTLQAKEDSDVFVVSVEAALEKLLPLLESMLHGRQMEISVEDALLPVRQVTTLTVLINELVSNAIKHGDGTVRIHFASDDNGCLILSVSDEGRGFPPDFTPAQAAHTGLDLIESLARYDLAAEIAYGNRPEGGAQVTLRFPRVNAAR